ncbi:MAG TPA: hypothetical protein VES21_03800 [Nocardioidaceae bacterium]|nr:hypothetical protein [Nocardioidaceae bacterium]
MSLAKPRGRLARGFELVADAKLLATMKGSLWRGGAAGSTTVTHEPVGRSAAMR